MCTRKHCRYIDVLKDIVHPYKNTKHCTTGMKPCEVTKGHVERYLWWHMYKPTESYEKSPEIAGVPFAYKKVTKFVYLIWSKPLKEHTMKSGHKKYLKWFNLINILEYVNIVFAI